MCSYVTDGTTAILIGCLPLVLPNKNPFSGNISHERLDFPEQIRSSQVGISADPHMESTVEIISLGCVYVARGRFGDRRCIQSRHSPLTLRLHIDE